MQKLNFLKRRTSSFLLIFFSLSFNSHAIAMSNKEKDIYSFGFAWGRASAICELYGKNLIKKNTAKVLLEGTIANGKKTIKDIDFDEVFVKTIEEDKNCIQLR